MPRRRRFAILNLTVQCPGSSAVPWFAYRMVIGHAIAFPRFRFRQDRLRARHLRHRNRAVSGAQSTQTLYLYYVPINRFARSARLTDGKECGNSAAFLAGDEAAGTVIRSHPRGASLTSRSSRTCAACAAGALSTRTGPGEGLLSPLSWYLAISETDSMRRQPSWGWLGTPSCSRPGRGWRGR